MKLSKLYSNNPKVFEPIDFGLGLNVVIAEIRLPENRDKDTHNLGKTTLGLLIDFMFLLGRNKNFFLFKHLDLFKDFVFFLELRLGDASYVTIRRGVDKASKVSFKKHEARDQDFRGLPDSRWDHVDLAFESARKMLDSLLDWREFNPWSFRKGLGYLLRSQHDYRDVFQLAKFSGEHSDWKPFLAHVLGFDGQLVTALYEKEAELEEFQSTVQTVQKELGGSVEDISKIEGLLLLKKQEALRKQQLLDLFDFEIPDKERTTHLVNEMDERIAALNQRRYLLSFNRKKIIASLEEDQILFNSDEAQEIFKDAGVLFEGQLKRDFDQLISFNRAITDERRSYLHEERSAVEGEITEVNSELNTLNKRRSDTLSFLSDTDVFNKYKEISDELVTLKADVASLERQREFIHRLQELRTKVRGVGEEIAHLQTQIENNVEARNSDASSLFSVVRLYFSEIVEEVINRQGLLSVSTNKLGHLEFKAEILNESGLTTSADLGYTYRKLLCIAFDLSLLRAHLEYKFPRFVYHDGVFESLDDRKRENLIAVYRRYADLGIQAVITLIDSDLPARGSTDSQVFNDDEIILVLHDEGDSGRLFKTRAW